MKVLITGAGGQLGIDLARLCTAKDDIVTALTRTDLDISDANAVHQVVSGAKPDVVFNCAAWTAVDDCESDPERAELVNGTAIRGLSSAAAGVGAHLVQVSTDYVFSGSKAGAYTETDQPDPASSYGRSKLLGEINAGENASVVRTSWVCSAHGGNMVATIARLIAAHPTLSFVSDQRGRPTFTQDLAAALYNLGTDRVGGVVHVANHGEVSWFEFAQAVVRAAGEDPARVSPIKSADLDPPRPAPRPANSVLSTEKYESLGYAPLPHFVESLDAVISSYL
ncbi:UNVERIFIED_CONTAM: hypothetical protein GTU68_010457 [Idotea baltica]|nr:hypothetical protein [Idotea baltica]